MLGIFNRMFRTSTRTQKWDAPEYWTDKNHMSAYDRQRQIAARNRERLARDIGINW